MPRIETLARVISRAAIFVVAATVERAVELPVSGDDSSVVNETEEEEQGATRVREMREREEEEGEEEEEEEEGT